LSLENCRDKKIGNAQLRGISGGQKKRMAIGRVLVSCPSILFLDEPTTGLSSTDSMTVMKNLEDLAQEVGITIVSVIHQPRNEVFHTFNNLMLMVPPEQKMSSKEWIPGAMVYQGPVLQAADYFTACGYEPDVHSNPADFFIDCISAKTMVQVGGSHEEGEKPETLPADPELFRMNYMHPVEGFHHSDGLSLADTVQARVDSLRTDNGKRFQDINNGQGYKDITVVYNKPKEAHLTFGFTVGQLFSREWNTYWRDPFRLSGRLTNGICMGLLIGILYKDIDITQIAAWALIFMELPALSSLVCMPVFFTDRPFFNLERSAGLYTTGPYFMATWLVGLVGGVLGNFLLCFIAYAFAGLPWVGFLPIFCFCLVIFLAMEALISFSAYMAKDQTEAIGMFNATIGIFMLFNGLTANRNISPPGLSWLCFTSPLYYGLEGILNYLSECSGLSDEDQDTVKNILTGSGTGQLKMDDNALGRDISILIGYTLLLKVAAFHMCHTKNKPER